ncbi:chaperone for protein-folding within the ER, fungal-domain-containing protein [Xylogone sp. PMI_703]|nr:chaperone for protein-folding within the ER, fungal-domain-containing protein [Xylogone sp. PMI_703]
MVNLSLQSLLLTGAYLIWTSSAQIDPQLVGTWSTKSGKVLTGPGFYNPVNDSFIEPSHTGISYSFTADGFYEEAYYRAVANPTNPKCPQAIMQFQHGKVIMNANLSLSFTPFAVDGRQLQSDPCSGDSSTYTRYNQTELMQKWQVYTDPYTKLTRLDLYKFDGSPMNPMFLAYRPPQMLPTSTLNPTATPTGKSKRGLEGANIPLNKNAHYLKKSFTETIDPNFVWWMGLGLTLFGGAAYLL